MSTMGIKVDKIDVPVCNSFKAKILNDQLCYEVDPDRFRTGNKNEMNLGLALLIDYNEDRNFDAYGKEDQDPHFITSDLENALIRPLDKKENYIYLGTIGKYKIIKELLTIPSIA